MNQQEPTSSLDIDLASHVQQLLFPKSSPACDWACIGVRNRMARGLGGDYYDFITMPDGCQAIFIGDVTGHGLHASVVMSLLYGFIHRSAQEVCSPFDLVRSVNEFLLSFARRSRKFDHYFSSTLFCANIDTETLEMTYVNAGHPAPMVLREGRILTLPATAPPVGFFAGTEIGSGRFRFRGGDRLLLFTDGITETYNPKGDLFGTDRLAAVLQDHDGSHLHFLEELFTMLEDFDGNEAPMDDRTTIVVDFGRGKGT